jgi:hypothetical protein
VILGTLLIIAGIGLFQLKAPPIPCIILMVFGGILIVFPNVDELEKKITEKNKKVEKTKSKKK